MFKILGALLQALRNLFFAISGSILKKMEDPVTGKIKWQSPQNLKKIGWGAFVVMFVSVMVYQISKANLSFFSGEQDYNEEMKNKVGVIAEEIKANDQLGDPLSAFKNRNYDEVNSSSEDKLDPNAPIDYGLCLKLLEKLKAGTKLVFDERIILKKCLDAGDLGLTPKDTALAQRLADDVLLSEEDKRLLDELFGSDKSCQAEVNLQATTEQGNALVNKILTDSILNQEIVKLLQDPSMLRNSITNPELLRKKLDMSNTEFALFQKLLEKCNPETLLKMLTDPKYRAVLEKLLKAALNDPDFMSKVGLTPEERDLLQKFLQGALESDSDDYAIANALIGMNPNDAQLAQDILKARALGDKELERALLAKLKGEEMTPEQMALAKNYNRDALNKAYDNRNNPELAAAYLAQAKGNQLTAEQLAALKAADDLGVDHNDKAALFDALSKDLSERQAELERLREQLAAAQAAAREGAKKLSDGLALSPEEQAALQRFADLQKAIAELEEKQRLRQQQIAKEITAMQSLVNRLGKTVKQIYPSGISGDLADWTKCEDEKPFTIVRKKPVRSGKKRGETFVTADGKELTPEQIQLLKAYRISKSQSELQKEREREALLNPNSSLVRNSSALNSQRAGGEGSAAGGIKQLFISDETSLVPFKLTPNMSIAGVLLTEILVSDKGSGQKVRVKILQDVYDPKTTKLVIPRNSIVFGETTSFDVDTHSMNLTLGNVAVGGDILQVPFTVASADLSPGLKGEIRDTRGKLLLGAFVSAFSAGAMGAISQNFISPYRQSTDFGENLTGSGLQGGAEVAQRIAELYAGDLQNAARIFFAPAGIKVVLTPN